MAFTVELVGNGYRISTGDGRPVTARSLPEIHEALDHYYRTDSKKQREQHTQRERPYCPFCAQIRAREAVTS